MRIVVLNGNPNKNARAFDDYLEQLQDTLLLAGHSSNLFTLRDMNIRQCVGCWGCWVQTPGECLTPDDTVQVRRAVVGADWLLLASPVIMGFASALLKRTMDRMIPLIHPYAVIDRGELHHRRRYERYPHIGLILQKQKDTDDEDIAIIADIFGRMSINLKSELKFARLTTDAVEEVMHEIGRV